MPTVHVALEDGFERDEVELQAGDVVVRREGVTTLTVIGLAEQVDLDAPAGAPLEVRLPRREVSTSLTLPSGVPQVSVGVSVRAGVLSAQVRQDGHGWA